MSATVDYDTVVDAAFCYQGLVMRPLLSHREGMTKTQLALMFVSEAEGPLAMSALSAKTGISKEQATRAVAPLVEQGFMQRMKDDDNRRLVLASITDQGRDFLERHRRRTDSDIEAQLNALTPEDRARLFAAAQTTVEVLGGIVPNAQRQLTDSDSI